MQFVMLGGWADFPEKLAQKGSLRVTPTADRDRHPPLCCSHGAHCGRTMRADVVKLRVAGFAPLELA